MKLNTRENPRVRAREMEPNSSLGVEWGGTREEGHRKSWLATRRGLMGEVFASLAARSVGAWPGLKEQGGVMEKGGDMRDWVRAPTENR